MSWHNAAPTSGESHETSRTSSSWSQPDQAATPSGWTAGGQTGWGTTEAFHGAVDGNQAPSSEAGGAVDLGPSNLGPPASPPLALLGLAAVLVVAGLVVFALGGGATRGVIGWALAGPAAIGALGAFLAADAKRAQSGWYRPSTLAEQGRRIVIGLAIVAVALNAFLIANDVARGTWR